jgi:penicillin-binding protein 1A
LGTRRWKIAAVCLGAFASGLVAGFGPLVRYEAQRVAERHGASIAVDEIRPTWSGLVLRGVDVRLRDVPSATVRLDEVAVELASSGRRLGLRGGNVTVVGARDVVLHELDTWRAGRADRVSSPSSARQGSSMELQGLTLLWKDRADSPTESLSATGVSVSRAEERTTVAMQEAALRSGPAILTVREGRVVLLRQDAGYRVEGLSASAVDAEMVLPAPALEAQELARDREGTTRPAQSNRAANRAESIAPEDRGAALRGMLVRVARGVDLALAEGAHVDVAGVTARLRRGTDKLNLGPGNLAVRRESGTLVIELSPGEPIPTAGAVDAQQALTFRLQVPIRDAADTPQVIIADVRGGPIGLSTLGVHEGDMGLFDVAHASLVSQAHVVLSADGQILRVDGEGKLRNLSLRSRALSEEPIAGLDLAWRAKAEAKLDGSRILVEDGEIDLGALRLSGRGEYQRASGSHRVRGEFEVPLSACQSMLDSVPKGLVAKLHGMRLAGSFGIKGRLRFDTASLDRGFLLDWRISNTCRVIEVPPELHVSRFKQPFRRFVYGPGGERVEIDAGPGTPDWVPYDEISRFMEVAVLTTEDGGFHRHHGFDEEAIKNSIRENLRKMHFVRGASTISMQLAKNVYLERTKSVARKLQEALLTMYLEQELTKEQMMELYLNVVEFGPMVYGVGAAAQHYFNTTAAQLSLGQSLYMSSILPNPKVQRFEAGGDVTPSWSEYLRKLMRIAHRRQRINDEELEAGLLETVVRGSPAPRMAPHVQRPERAVELPDDAQDGAWMGP